MPCALKPSTQDTNRNNRSSTHSHRSQDKAGHPKADNRYLQVTRGLERNTDGFLAQILTRSDLAGVSAAEALFPLAFDNGLHPQARNPNFFGWTSAETHTSGSRKGILCGTALGIKGSFAFVVFVASRAQRF